MTSITLPGLGIVVIAQAVLLGMAEGFYGIAGGQPVISVWPRPYPPHHSFKLIHCEVDGFEFWFYASEFELDLNLSCIFVACD